MTGGIGQEAWVVNRDVSNKRVQKADGTFEFGKTKTTWTISNTGLAISLGNQWMWKHFTLGCDWVGGLVNLRSTSKREKPDNADEEDFNRFDRSVKNNYTGNTLHVLRLYLGFAF